jgi:hypothetical protein
VIWEDLESLTASEYAHQLIKIKDLLQWPAEKREVSFPIISNAYSTSILAMEFSS